ncbi:MAG TPA: LLM class flavin-dependent oxidoreductase [Chloroflexaceae bacterium]|nr:LLM class flavin-dependent oxidoreductase [Chloroflexaceae bacterium]
MRYGFVMPFGDARAAADLAARAEAAGWDGFFVWEPVWGWDAWVSLTAAAMRTERIRLGTMLTPLSRMRPWKLASETANLDHLSGGRVTLAVGLGAPDTGFANFGEQTDRRVRAELLDEGLAIVTGLWRGEPFAFKGKHYTIDTAGMHMGPAPSLQRPRIPIWTVGAWPSERSMARALRYDGLIPSARGADGQMRQVIPDELRAAVAYARERRGGEEPYDIVVEGVTPGDDPAAARAVLAPWAEAGATWWLESMWTAPDAEAVRRRVEAGPPAA